MEFNIGVCKYIATCTLSDAEVDALASCCRILGIQMSPEQEQQSRALLREEKYLSVSLQTGAGKSICYAILPLLFTPSGKQGLDCDRHI